MSRRKLAPGFIGLWIVLMVYTYFYFMCPLFQERKYIDKISTFRGQHRADSEIKVDPKIALPWYMQGGTLGPGKISYFKTNLFPESRGPDNDGIHEQLMVGKGEGMIKKIMLRDNWEGIELGRDVFERDGCPISQCSISRDIGADLVIFRDNLSAPGFPRGEGQIWMMYSLESPAAGSDIQDTNMFNWTATYRRDSTIVAPYGKWRYYNTDIKYIKQEKNFALGKTKGVAWFVSNCETPNDRLAYAKELSRYIQVDIYGDCGNLTCPSQNDICNTMLRDDYKFYLAFENSNCQDYITEKFFLNALSNDVIPIVMGARPSDYTLVAPLHSYIHVDQFQGPGDLANFLHKLNKSDQLYNQFFQWKGTGEFFDTRFFCRVCSMLHSGEEGKVGKVHQYKNIKKWWSRNGICTNKTWTTQK